MLLCLMLLKATPNDEISVRVNKILHSYKRIPDKLMFMQKVLMFLYINEIRAFDLCCELLGKRISIQMVPVNAK